MTPTDDHEPEFGGDEALAAEFVLGVLPAEERAAAARRIETDASFARLIDDWELRLAPLSEAYAPVEAPASVKQALDRRLFATTAAAPARASLWNSLGLWRGLAAAAVLALAVTAGLNLRPAGEAPGDGTSFVATLENPDTDVRYLALYDPETETIRLSHLAGAAGDDQDFELWVIEGDEAPASLGVIADTRQVAFQPADDLRGKLAPGSVLAVSLEPTGGSPTGQPTGPVVALGNLQSI